MEGMKVLLVDDEKDMLDVLSKEFEREGVDVVAECGVEGAMERIRTESFDCLVTDGYMPGESGFELAGHLRQLCPQTRRILVSGFYNEGEVAHSIFHKVFRKPIDAKKLVAYVKENA
jgi:DNA-binding NtrC family response regulator